MTVCHQLPTGLSRALVVEQSKVDFTLPPWRANFAANQSRANRRFRAYRLAYRSLRTASKVQLSLLHRALQPLLRALQQSAVSVSTDLSTIQKSTVSLVNRPVNRALLTIQKMPVCVGTGWIPASWIPLHKAKTQLNGRAGCSFF